MKIVAFVAGIALSFAAAGVAHAGGKPVATCDSADVLWGMVEGQWGMRQWPQQRNSVAGMWQDRAGKKWVFETDGEGACLKPFKEKKGKGA